MLGCHLDAGGERAVKCVADAVGAAVQKLEMMNRVTGIPGVLDIIDVKGLRERQRVQIAEVFFVVVRSPALQQTTPEWNRS